MPRSRSASSAWSRCRHFSGRSDGVCEGVWLGEHGATNITVTEHPNADLLDEQTLYLSRVSAVLRRRQSGNRRSNREVSAGAASGNTVDNHASTHESHQWPP